MKTSILVLTVYTFCIYRPLIAQNKTTDKINSEYLIESPNPCGTIPPDPVWDKWFNEKVTAYKQKHTESKVSQDYIIPVIVHVIHGGEAVGTYPNISSAQVSSQIQILNEDYSGVGFNSQSIPAVFKDLKANTGIRFCLAETDTLGQKLAEPGIDRIKYSTKGFNNPASITSSSQFMSYVTGTIKPKTIWDPKNYFNVWITDKNTSMGTLGYATFPAGTTLSGFTQSSTVGTDSTDGVWCYTKAFGNIESVDAPYNKGRVLTHESGHWFGLRHISGDASCGDDFCNDTPPQKGGYSNGQNGLNWGNPPEGWKGKNGLCPGNTSGFEMFMNFMDYPEDSSKYMFSLDQAIRMKTALSEGTFRNVLGTHSLCTTEFGVKETILETNVKVFPNPSFGLIQLSFTLPYNMDLNYTLINTLGQEVLHNTKTNIQNDSIELDLNSFEKGFYLLKINSGNTTSFKKIILY